jgi:hypothetical protein
LTILVKIIHYHLINELLKQLIDGGFFVFGDLAVKKEGKFKLKFSLFEIVEGQVQNRRTILSDTFTVFIPKQFPGPVEATFLSRTFSDQGVKMRIRKEHRLQS